MFGRMLQKLLLCGCAAGALSTGASTLKYFGVWELEAADPVADRVSEFANFLFTSNDMASIKRFPYCCVVCERHTSCTLTTQLTALSVGQNCGTLTLSLRAHAPYFAFKDLTDLFCCDNRRFQDAGVGPSLLDVESTFFMPSPTGLVLHPDYQVEHLSQFRHWVFFC